MSRRVISALFAGLMIVGCATQTPYVRDGKTYGVTQGVFRGRWWSYCERGGSFLDGGFYEEAEGDFHKALVGRSRDTWQARTYGLHFVEYFPNRELGITYYEMGRLDEAEQYLTASLEQVDTARAHHYLDEVRKAQIAQGRLQDAREPALAASIHDGAVLAARQVPITIDASDDLGVAAVSVNGRRLHQRGSAASVSFADELVLAEGTHAIRINAADLADKAAAESVNVTIDLTGPAIGIFEPAPDLVTDAAAIRLRGATLDRNGVTSVLVDNRVLAQSTGDVRMPFEAELALKNGANTFIVTATDVAGNETRMAVSVYKGTQSATASFLMHLPEDLLRPLRFAHVSFIEPPRCYPPLARRFARVADTSGAAAGPAIEMKFPKESLDDYRLRDLTVAGTVKAATTVDSVIVAGERIELVPAPMVEFNKRVPVERGDNLIAVRAQDNQGGLTEETVSVKSKYFALEDARMSVAVMGFGGPVEDNSRTLLRQLTEQQLFERERFDIVERERLADVLTEQQLSEALGDPDSALRLGKVIPAQVFIVGQVVAHGDAGLEVFADVISTETSRKFAKLDAFIDNRNDRAKMEYGADAIADALVEYFPRVPGEVLGAAGKNVILDFGEKQGIRADTYVVLVHEDPPFVDETTGEVLMPGSYAAVGRGVIGRVLEDRCQAEMVEQEGDGGIGVEKGMPAVTM